jgi:hypothetical protein
VSAPSRAELDAFQQLLNRVLFEEADPIAARARLCADPASAPFRAYVESFEPRLLEAVGRLARRWGSTSDAWAPPRKT